MRVRRVEKNSNNRFEPALNRGSTKLYWPKPDKKIIFYFFCNKLFILGAIALNVVISVAGNLMNGGAGGQAQQPPQQQQPPPQQQQQQG